jgi:O-acetyl-ADP-ribose deacetylase (regulator of RNase III)
LRFLISAQVFITFPKEKAAAIALQTIQNFPDKDYFDKIVFVCFDDENFQLYKNHQTQSIQ